ncbi:MAG: hypothetical protein NT058_00445 [Candidatus Portnoybacteria bacterium]|nr:hypothetical protein [Candidatus Portnoybacteria bacterium]
MEDKKIKILLSIGTIIIVAVFAVSLFKNIAYPLLWNDEASTAMFGKRVLQYGYPKVHDDKNSLYLWSDQNHDIGTRSNGDVYIAEGWTQYYLAALGDSLANKSDDVYVKTAMLRIPFAVAGFLGIIIFGLTIGLFFNKNRKWALIAFFIFELFSISLILHLREVRYYSLVILFASIIFNVYIRHVILKTLKYKHYLWVISLLVVLLFHTHYPIAAAFMVALGIHSLILAFSRCEKKLSIFVREFFKLALPLFVSLIFIIPSLVYFKTLITANALTTEYALGFGVYVRNVVLALSFFAKFEFLCLAIFLKILLAIFIRNNKNNNAEDDKILIKTSNFLTLFFCVYILVIARSLYVFERYIIVLQPVLVCIILLDILLCWRRFHYVFVVGEYSRRAMLKMFLVLILMATGFNLIPQIKSIKGHLYEITHRYKGPLDFVIPYIQEKYGDSSKIIIATNYEENSYMYYLDSKTIVGYVGNNLTEDRKLQPDVVIYRKYRNFDQDYVDVFNAFLNAEKYQKINFPIFDYPYNNIPELNYMASHLYKTKLTNDDAEKLDIYVKQ